MPMVISMVSGGLGRPPANVPLSHKNDNGGEGGKNET